MLLGSFRAFPGPTQPVLGQLRPFLGASEYKYEYAPGSRLLHPLLRPRRAWAYTWKRSLRGRQGLEPAKVRR
jgi:hypothetical protein